MKTLGCTPENFESFTKTTTITETLDQLERLYADAITALRNDFEHYSQNGVRKTHSDPTYPFLLLHITERKEGFNPSSGFVSVREAGWYGSSITSPDIFRGYLTDQLERIDNGYVVEFYVGCSTETIPLAFAIDPSAYETKKEYAKNIGDHFALPDLKLIHDDIADGTWEPTDDAPLPLSLFPALRTDYSLQRLKHYTGTAPEHFQKFVIYTNYQRYVDEFIDHAKAAMGKPGYHGFASPGQGLVTRAEDYNPAPDMKLPQMPAYHLVGEGNMGVTLINIGVGPSNAKTITDHVAVLRSHCWMMLGHCGGLRHSQVLGDFVLAHAYLRDDQILDEVLPTAIPLPTIAEVQIAITEAIGTVMELSGHQMKRHVRTGTVVTTSDRNWEMRYAQLRTRLNQSRAIAIDMESATIAANGYRYRVPYGTLLCVSDKPLHGEIKLPGQAEVFYRSRVAQHLIIGMEAMSIMKDAAESGQLHSRKLRSLDDPVFR